MFALSYTTRCLVCRAAFLAVCVVPTMAVLLYAGWIRHPAHLAGYERRLETRLRMSASIAAVEQIQPGRMLLHNVELRRRTSGRWLFRTPKLETGSNEATLVLIASHVDLSGDCWAHLVDLLEEHAAGSNDTVALSASRVNWHCGQQVTQLEQLVARLQQGESGPVCELRFRLQDRRAAEPVRLMVARVRDDERQLTGYEFDTGDLHVPCSLALPALPWLVRLGPHAEFSGHVILYHGDEGWQGELRGRLRGIDLRRLMSDPIDQEVHGMAELRLERARFDRNRLSHASGTLTAGPGMIGPSLRLSAIRSWRLVASPAAAQSAELLPYDELALQFTITSAGLNIAGACLEGPKGTILGDRHQPLLSTAGPEEHLPLVSLIHLLAPTSNELVPASRQAGRLLEMLPTP